MNSDGLDIQTRVLDSGATGDTGPETWSSLFSPDDCWCWFFEAGSQRSTCLYFTWLCLKITLSILQAKHSLSTANLCVVRLIYKFSDSSAGFCLLSFFIQLPNGTFFFKVPLKKKRMARPFQPLEIPAQKEFQHLESRYS